MDDLRTWVRDDIKRVELPIELTYGVRLDHLIELAKLPYVTFDSVANIIIDRVTESPEEGFLSYATSLMLNESTKHLVKDMADVVVSYSPFDEFGRVVRS